MRLEGSTGFLGEKNLDAKYQNTTILMILVIPTPPCCCCYRGCCPSPPPAAATAADDAIFLCFFLSDGVSESFKMENKIEKKKRDSHLFQLSFSLPFLSSILGC